MTLKAWARLALVAIVAVLFQLSVLDTIAVHGAHPDVMILLAIGAGMAAGSQRGAVVGFAIGLLADLFVDTPFGLSAFAFVLVAFAVGLAPTTLSERAGPLSQIGMAAVATAGGTLLYAGAGYVFGQPGILRDNIVAIISVVTAANALLALPTLASMRWALAPIKPSRPGAEGQGSWTAR